VGGQTINFSKFRQKKENFRIERGKGVGFTINHITSKIVWKAGVNFINVLCARFSYKILAPKITKLCFGFEVLPPKSLYKKRTSKTLMKLTPGR